MIDHYLQAQMIHVAMNNKRRGKPLTPSVNSARGLAKEISEKTYASWVLLNASVKARKARIREKWNTMNKLQRRAMLFDVAPDMPANRRPDIEAFVHDLCEGSPEPDENNHFAYFTPLINVEDLLHGEKFLLFLNSRARHHPEAFAWGDLNALRLGAFVPGLYDPYLIVEGHTMMLTGQRTPETYGQLISWSEDSRALEWVLSDVHMLFHPGLLVLRARSRILRFLVIMAIRLLEQEVNGLPAVPQTETPRIRLFPGSPLESVIAETLYRIPITLDVSQILSIPDAKRRASIDHVFALREDLGYFAEALIEVAEPQPESLPFALTGMPLAEDRKESAFLWRLSTRKPIDLAYFSVATWDTLHEQFKKPANTAAPSPGATRLGLRLSFRVFRRFSHTGPSPRLSFPRCQFLPF